MSVCFLTGADSFGIGGFERVVPFAAKYDARLVFVNRRDFPGSDPYTEAEYRQLEAAQSPVDGRSVLQAFMKERAREVYDFLAEYVIQEGIPRATASKGGLILTTWSFGSVWLTALLANLKQFSSDLVQLSAYVRRTILYGTLTRVPKPSRCRLTLECDTDPPSNVALGYPLPAVNYHPLRDETIPPLERPQAFVKWVTGYYTHGDSPDTLELYKPVADPPPTILNMTPEEIQTHFCEKPAGPDGSDALLVTAMAATGLNSVLRKTAFYLDKDDEASEGEIWAGTELRYLWCDRSVYEQPWGTWSLRRELQEAREKELKMRNITVVLLEGANHFVSATSSLTSGV